MLRFRPALWSAGQESYLAELYVAPAERGRGLGRGILTAALRLARERGADSMDLGTSEDDVAARALYESVGFVNRERPDGPITYFYELELTSDRRRGPERGPVGVGRQCVRPAWARTSDRCRTPVIDMSCSPR